jgi:hypothetical protein
MARKVQRWFELFSNPWGLLFVFGLAILQLLTMYKRMALVSYVLMGAIFVYLAMMIYAVIARE